MQEILHVERRTDFMGLVKNPVMPGFYPDPSVCHVDRVDERGKRIRDYYMVHSTFCYVPGLPIFHSTDLCRWEQIGHVLTRESQLVFNGDSMSRGMFAPCIRYHKGIFYVACTNVSHGGNFYVTAKDPAGPWSDPVYLPEEEAKGIDPSLFFDGDTCYYIGQRTKENAAYNGDCEVWIQELDLEKGQLTGPVSVLWDGAMKHAVWPEGPHIYKRGDYYYLLIAEGGTSVSHSICVARSKSLRGPYESCPNNPVFTHRHLGNKVAVQNVGHADLIEHEDGSWYAFMLATRPLNARLSKGIYAKNTAAPLGRETFVAAVEWQEDWPVFNPCVGMLQEYQQIGDGEATEESLCAADHLIWQEPLDQRCLFFRYPKSKFYQVVEQEKSNIQPEPAQEKGIMQSESVLKQDENLLALQILDEDFSTKNSPAYIGVRVTSLNFSLETTVMASEMTSGEAGLVYLYDENNYVKLVLKKAGLCKNLLDESETGYQAVLSLVEDSVETQIAKKEVGSCCKLRFALEGLALKAYVDGTELGSAVNVANLTSENIGGFVGCTMGVYAGGAAMNKIQPEYVYFSTLKIQA